MDPRDKAASDYDYDTIACDLDLAAKHARTAAQHLKNRNIPSSAAHTLAPIGHIEIVRELLNDRAKFAASMAQP